MPTRREKRCGTACGFLQSSVTWCREELLRHEVGDVGHCFSSEVLPVLLVWENSYDLYRSQSVCFVAQQSTTERETDEVCTQVARDGPHHQVQTGIYHQQCGWIESTELGRHGAHPGCLSASGLSLAGEDVGLASEREKKSRHKREEGRQKTRTELKRESAFVYYVMVYTCPYMYNFYKHLGHNITLTFSHNFCDLEKQQFLKN